ncbi:MAG: SLC13 family permease [Candidatus Methanomethylophilaceae archaeon]|nr:SLC13 family permease [Candidatus Methanomethylophilaceae archaeon]MDY0223859.1 SLC13 family permease [Candidatus Methanomethylophilaceae archaeon]
MSYVLIAAFAIFLFTYLLISVRRLPTVNVRRDVAALLGGVLMLVFGIVSLREAWDFIDFDVIFLLLGMMLLITGLEFTGFFEIIVSKLISKSPSKRKLLIMIMLISAFLSAIMLNDAVVLLFTPIVIRCCRALKANPIPYLVAVFVSANIGSVSTVIGNPQNAYIATKAGIDFIDFSIRLVPLAVICLAVAILFVCFFYRKSMDEKLGRHTNQSIQATRSVDRYRLYFMLILLVATVFFFAISSYIGVKLSEIAMVSGAISLLIVMTRGTSNAIWVVKRIDWSILFFFIGLFILMAGVVQSGLLQEIANLFPGFGYGEIPTIGGLTLFSAILANLISNVPSVMLIGEMLPAGDVTLWLTLAAASTLAGNATLMGAAANIIVAEEAEKVDIKLNFWKYIKIGIPMSVITLIITILFLTYL